MHIIGVHFWTYRRLHLPVNAHAQHMFSHDAKILRIRCQTLKFSRPNVKFQRQLEFSWFTQFAVSAVKKCEENLRKSLHLYGEPKNSFLSRTSSEMWMEIYEYMPVNYEETALCQQRAQIKTSNGKLSG